MTQRWTLLTIGTSDPCRHDPLTLSTTCVFLMLLPNQRQENVSAAQLINRFMEPLEFTERLAVLGPRLRLHLIRFHGVLANIKLCRKIVPVPLANASPQRRSL